MRDEGQIWSAPFTLDTPRLCIAPCDNEAALALAKIVMDPRVYAPFYVGQQARFPAAVDLQYWIQLAHDWKDKSRFNLAVRLRGAGAVIGHIQFTPVQVAYFVHPEYWQNGYGREMLSAACHIPRLLGIGTLEARVIRENIGSRRILEHIGFAFKGITTRAWGGGSGTVTMLRYELLEHREGLQQ